jgi:dihydrofolate reductase
VTARCSVFIATSLDGFIAREDGRIDWLEHYNGLLPDGEDCGHGAFIATVDALVMGRHTFEQVLSFDAWPYGGKPVIVLGSHPPAIPSAVAATVSASRETPRALVERLSARGMRRLYIDGGLTIQSFLREGLIEELTITVIPLLLGSGRPLFGRLPREIRLELLSSRSYDCGFVQSRYRVVQAAAA